MARDTLKHFIQFLGLTAPTIAIGLWEVSPLALKHVRLVLQQQWDSASMYERWWNHWYSWSVGPTSRYGGGLYLCYWHYEDDGVTFAMGIPPASIGPVIWTIWGVMLAILTAALCLITTKNMLKGSSTLEEERSKIASRFNVKRLVWVPNLDEPRDQEGRCQGKVLELPRQTKLYDFGWRKNWKRVFSSVEEENPCTIAATYR